MVSTCLSSVNGALTAAAAASSSTWLEGRLTLSQGPRSLCSLRPLELRMLSLSSAPTRRPCRHGFSVVGQAYAELSVEEVEALDASSDEDEREEREPVEPFDSSGSPGLEIGTKLYVGNLPWSCNSEELAGVFQKAGSVDMVEVIYDRESGRSRGFGFVTMSSVEDCHGAIQKLDGADYAGRTLRVNFPNRNRTDAPIPRAPRTELSNMNKLFVGNLAWGVDNAMLHDLFSEHGKVLEARVVNDRDTGRSRGFGFVTMSSEAEVNEALNKMDGASVEGRSLRVNMAGERPASRSEFI